MAEPVVQILDLSAHDPGGRFGAVRARRMEPQSTGASAFPALIRTLDMLEQSLVFLDSMGRAQHANSAFLQEIRIATDSAFLRAQVAHFAQSIWALALGAGLGERVEQLDTRTVPGARGEYRLQGTYIGADLLGMGASVMVALHVPRPDPFATEHLRSRYKLTPKQSQVARLLAQGLRNVEIAQRLFLSSHTVRHHVERIRDRVGGHTRAAIVDRIRRDA